MSEPTLSGEVSEKTDRLMRTPGGRATMLGRWRVVLRQAEEAARAGRYDEAFGLANRPDVAEYRPALMLRAKIAQELIARATRRAAADDLDGAIADLNQAEICGAAPDVLATARLAVADSIAGELRSRLDAGDPLKIIERVDALARHKIGNPALRRLKEAAEAWQAAQTEVRRGEFGLATEHFQRAERLAGEGASSALTAARSEIEARRTAAQPRIEKLYAVLGSTGSGAGELLAAAEAVLELVPEHAAARQGRTRAWQQIGALSPTATLTHSTVPAPKPAPSVKPVEVSEPSSGEVRAWVPPPPAATPNRVFGIGPNRERPEPVAVSKLGRFMLWVDAVGGYLVCCDERVLIGRASLDGLADVPLLGDLSRQHATLLRDGESYVVQAHRGTFLNGRRVENAALKDRDILRLGSTVELEFRQPNAISSTARLEVLGSQHRLPQAVHAVLLMGETCILSPAVQAHVVIPGLAAQVVLYRQGSELWCRAPGGFEVDGRPCVGRARLGPTSQVLGDGYSFSLEPLAERPTFT